MYLHQLPVSTLEDLLVEVNTEVNKVREANMVQAVKDLMVVVNTVKVNPEAERSMAVSILVKLDTAVVNIPDNQAVRMVAVSIQGNKAPILDLDNSIQVSSILANPANSIQDNQDSSIHLAEVNMVVNILDSMVVLAVVSPSAVVVVVSILVMVDKAATVPHM